MGYSSLGSVGGTVKLSSRHRERVKMGDIRPDSVVRASMRQISADLDGETVVLNFDDGIYYSVNEVGARIWSLVQDLTSVADVMATLLDEFNVEPARCEADLVALLSELRRRNLIEVRDANGP